MGTLKSWDWQSEEALMCTSEDFHTNEGEALSVADLVVIKKCFMQRSATLLHTRSQFSWRAARNIIFDSLYARVNAKLKVSAMRLLSDFFF